MYKFNEIKQCRKCSLIFYGEENQPNVIYKEATYDFGLIKACPRCGWQWQEEVAEHEDKHDG